MSASDYIRILPELVLTVFGMLVMLIDPLLPEHNDRKGIGVLALIGSLLAIAATLYQSTSPGQAWFGMVQVDSFSIFFHLIVGFVVATVILASFEYLAVQGIRLGEYYGLILLGAVGMMLMSSAIELVLIFIALEISSISTYILAGFRRHSAASAESSLKYFLLGSFATAFFLYGVALMFGATGSTSIYPIAASLRAGTSTLAYAGVALMFIGLGFKVPSPRWGWIPNPW